MVQTVLVVDDEKMIREAVSSYLQKQGCQVFQADNGQDALDIFDKEAITFVILDLMLPDMTGENICCSFVIFRATTTRFRSRFAVFLNRFFR